jgi:hypothetical protein
LILPQTSTESVDAHHCLVCLRVARPSMKQTRAHQTHMHSLFALIDDVQLKDRLFWTVERDAQIYLPRLAFSQTLRVRRTIQDASMLST